MADIFDKCAAWKDYKIAVAAGFYPYFRPIAATHGTEVEVDGRRILLAASDDALGLATDPRVKEAAATAVKQFGSSSPGPRPVSGTLSVHEELEEGLAAYLGREAAVVAPSGFQARIAALAALLEPGDAVCVDSRSRAVLREGVGAAGCQVREYRHNEMSHLESSLTSVAENGGKLVATEGVFGIEGDLCNLPKVVELAQRHGARTLLDESAAVGLLGEKGRGAAEYFGLEPHVDLVMGTLSKGLAAHGGFLAGSAEVIQYVKHRSRAVIFSSSIPPASAAAALKALQILEAEPQRRTRMFDIAQKMHDGFRSMGFDTGVSVTPIVPVLIGDPVKCFRFWRALFDAGIFTSAIVPPAVEADHALIRTSYLATHTDAQLDRVLETFDKVGRKLGVLPETRPQSVRPAQIARPGTFHIASEASPRWAAGTPQLTDDSTLSLEQLRSLSSRDVAQRLFDAVEVLTWRAANLQPEDLSKLGDAPFKLWQKRADLPALLIEKGAQFLLRNGKREA